MIHYSSKASSWCSIFHGELGKWICPFTELLGKSQHVFSSAGKRPEKQALKVREGTFTTYKADDLSITYSQLQTLISFWPTSLYSTSQSPRQTSLLPQTGFYIFMSTVLLSGSSSFHGHNKGLVRFFPFRTSFLLSYESTSISTTLILHGHILKSLAKSLHIWSEHWHFKKSKSHRAGDIA